LNLVGTYLRTGSLRQAAAEHHLHHSSVARRVTAAARTCDWDLESPDGRLAARLDLTLAWLATS
jgi:DNA-binding PucR family transcriptional regulator